MQVRIISYEMLMMLMMMMMIIVMMILMLMMIIVMMMYVYYYVGAFVVPVPTELPDLIFYDAKIPVKMELELIVKRLEKKYV